MDSPLSNRENIPLYMTVPVLTANYAPNSPVSGNSLDFITILSSQEEQRNRDEHSRTNANPDYIDELDSFIERNRSVAVNSFMSEFDRRFRSLSRNIRQYIADELQDYDGILSYNGLYSDTDVRIVEQNSRNPVVINLESRMAANREDEIEEITKTEYINKRNQHSVKVEEIETKLKKAKSSGKGRKRKRIHIEEEHKHSESSECMICFSKEQELFRAPCGHMSCKGCWKKWLDIQKKCPFCRKRTRFHHLSTDELLRK